MDQADKGKPPATASEAVALATRLLRFQVELSGCRPEDVRGDRFVAGYLQGFCSGILTGLHTNSPGLFALHSMVCRAVFGDRDGAGIVEHVARARDDADFREGERVGMADALRSITEARAVGGLVVHVEGTRRRASDAAAGEDPQ